jgi:hypothetical protein
MTAGTMRNGQRVLSQGEEGLRAVHGLSSTPLPHPLEVRHA